MKASLRRILFWAVPLTVLAAALTWAFGPQPIDADFAVATRGPLVVTVAEQGETRIRDVYVVSAPIRGRKLRMKIKEGDAVVANETLIAEIEPSAPAFLDVRSEAEARAAVGIAEAALELSRAELRQALATQEFALSERDRMRTLRANDRVAERALDEAERNFRTAQAAVATAEAAVRMRRSELRAAQVRLLGPTEASQLSSGCPCVELRAPVSGSVLRVHYESEGVVEAGQLLAEIGDPDDLEVVVDFLSSDAVRIEPGQRAIIEEWGGDAELSGRVSRVEPYGFTKVSALGIEEQRVNVRIDFAEGKEVWRRLGHGFQVEARVVLHENPSALKIPLTALFRNGGGWAVFTVEDDRAALRRVEIGRRTDLEAEILSGLEEGENVVLYPSDRIEAGVRLRRR